MIVKLRIYKYMNHERTNLPQFYIDDIDQEQFLDISTNHARLNNLHHILIHLDSFDFLVLVQMFVSHPLLSFDSKNVFFLHVFPKIFPKKVEKKKEYTMR